MKPELSLIHIVDEKGRLRIKDQGLEFVYIVTGLDNIYTFTYRQLTKQRPC